MRAILLSSAVLVVFMINAVLAANIGATNVVHNGSFTYTDSDGNLVNRYSPPEWGNDTNGFWARVDHNAPDGECGSFTQGTIWQYNLGQVVGGQTYEFSFQANINEGGANLLARVLDQENSNDPVLNSVDYTPAITGSWTPYTYTFTVVPGANGHTVGVLFGSSTTNGGWVNIDNVSLTAVPEPGTVALVAAGLLAYAWRKRR